MAPFLLLLVLLAEAASDLEVVTVRPGDNATLSCRADDSPVRVVKWSKDDPKPKTILYYSDGHLEKEEQNPSFRDRVELVDTDLKDRDVSLTLKNVSINDAGQYKCGVKTGDLKRTKRDINSDPIRTIRIIRLQVTGPKDGPSSPGGQDPGLVAGVVVGLVLAVAVGAVAGVLYKNRREQDILVLLKRLPHQVPVSKDGPSSPRLAVGVPVGLVLAKSSGLCPDV